MLSVLVLECVYKYTGNCVIILSVNIVGELVVLILMIAIHFCTKR